MRLLTIMLLLSVTRLTAQDPFELLRQIDDPNLPTATRQANVTIVARKAGDQPLLCVELARRLALDGSGEKLSEPVGRVLTDPQEFCAQHLVETIQVLSATNDDTDIHYFLLTKEQLEANPEFVRSTLFNYCGDMQAVIMADLVERFGLTEHVDYIAQCVIQGSWGPSEEIESRHPDPHFAGHLTSLWQLNYGPILLALRTSENQEVVDRALQEIQSSLKYHHEDLGEGEEPNLSEVRLLDEISAVLQQ